MPTITTPAATQYQPALRQQAQLIALPAFTDNYFWLICKNDQAIVVDPGLAEPVQQLLQENQLQLKAILLTHHHNDHVGGVLALQAANQAVVYGPKNDKLPACDHALEEGQTLNFPELDLQLSILDVPGHTLGHIAYHGQLAGQAILFCGDTLFAAGCGRVFEGTPQQMHASLQKLAALPPQTLVCCAHEYTISNLQWALAVEPDNTQLQQQMILAQQLRQQNLPTLPSTIGTELSTNPFLRTQVPAIVSAASQYDGKPLVQPDAVFASLRNWKNHF